ncbi:MAG: methyltransferase domain-containing protein [Pirellulales bacterium]|nr:methyltransferase domain-containing protein [Pirellulales bacterium]
MISARQTDLQQVFSSRLWHHDVSRRVVETDPDFGITQREQSRKYPSRLIRYFVPFHWLGREAVRRGRPLRVCEIGIAGGMMPRYLEHGLKMLGLEFSDVIQRWVGVDIKLRRERLAEMPYDELVEANLETDVDRIPADCDVCILLHVLEHLHDPDAALEKLLGQFKPGTLLIAGFPCHPHFAIPFRQPYLRRFTKGNGHVSAMSNPRFIKTVRAQGCTMEAVVGGYFLRASGLFLEDHAWWQRFNLAWGRWFPAWPGESFLAARTPGDPIESESIAPAQAVA